MTTNVTILLDGSTSMHRRWGSAIQSINSYVDGLNTLPSDSRIKILMFKDKAVQRGTPAQRWNGWVSNESGVEPVAPLPESAAVLSLLHEGPLSSWSPLLSSVERPHGNTPLNDASYDVLNSIITTSGPNDRNIVVIITDGEENCSRAYTETDVKQLVQAFEAKEWEVMSIGVDFDRIFESASSYGVAFDKTMMVNSLNLDSSMRGLASKTAAYAATGTRMEFTDSDRQQASK